MLISCILCFGQGTVSYIHKYISQPKISLLTNNSLILFHPGIIIIISLGFVEWYLITRGVLKSRKCLAICKFSCSICIIFCFLNYVLVPPLKALFWPLYAVCNKKHIFNHQFPTLNSNELIQFITQEGNNSDMQIK